MHRNPRTLNRNVSSLLKNCTLLFLTNCKGSAVGVSLLKASAKILVKAAAKTLAKALAESFAKSWLKRPCKGCFKAFQRLF